MSDQQNQQYQEDTISLIDLLAVLVRFRRMIIWGTLLVAVVTGFVLYGLPAIQGKEITSTEFEARVRLTVSPVPRNVEQYMGLSIVGAMRDLLQDPVVVGNAYRQVEPQLVEGPINPERTEEQYLAMIEEDIIGERISTSWNGSTSILTVSFTALDKELAVQFLELLLVEFEEEFVPLVRSRVTVAEETIQRNLEEARAAISGTVVDEVLRDRGGISTIDSDMLVSFLEANADSALRSLVNLVNDQEQLETIAADVGTIYGRIGNPIVVEVRKGGGITGNRRGQAVVAVITAFFLLVFLAFVRQYIDNVEHDSEEMRKLKAAWKGQEE